MLRLLWQGRQVEFARLRPIIIRVEIIRVSLAVVIPAMQAAVTLAAVTREIPAAIIPRRTTHRMAAEANTTSLYSNRSLYTRKAFRS